MTRERFSKGTSKIGKHTAGPPVLGKTPVVIRSPEVLGEGFTRRIRTQLTRRLGRAAVLIERITVRFEDVNGPKGGDDKVCRIKVVIRGRPSVLVEKRAHSHASAFARASAAIGAAVSREQNRRGLRTGHRPGPSAAPHSLDRALRRPEKPDGVFTAPRNSRARTTRATVALEDSRTRPSRKSTRRSANRGKPSHAKEHAAAVQLSMPRARASRRG